MTQEAQVKSKNLTVTMTDGSTKVFGEKGRLLSSHKVTDAGIEITFHIVTGDQITFKHKVSNIDNFTAEAAAFGFMAKAKAATAGAKVEEIASVISSKVKEFESGVFATRSASGNKVTPLTQLATAYAVVNGLDPENLEDVAEVNAHFASLTKEEKSKLYDDVDIQVELAKIRLAIKQSLKAKSA